MKIDEYSKQKKLRAFVNLDELQYKFIPGKGIVDSQAEMSLHEEVIY